MKHVCPMCDADCDCEDYQIWGDCSHCGISPLTRLRADGKVVQKHSVEYHEWTEKLMDEACNAV